jgi:DNA-binding NarL/FixJ family response regulator
MVDRHQPDKEILLLINMGFHGFVEHSHVTKTLGAAVRSVAGGRVWFSEELMQQYVYTSAEAKRSSGEGQLLLTLRETEVLDLVRRRLSNREISTLLGITESTVKYHLSHILAKFRVTKRRKLETGSATGSAQIWDQISKH